MEEKWRPVVGYEGLYEVSNLGRVKSLDRDIEVQHKGEPVKLRHFKGKILKQGRRQDGYADVSLSRQGVTTLHCVHRLIAQAWIPNPDNLDCVNHKDLDKTNNSLDNLEWVSTSDNMRHASANYSSSQIIPVYCYETDKVYPSMNHCDRALGFTEGFTHNVIRHNRPSPYTLRLATNEEIEKHKSELDSIPGWTYKYKKKGRLHPIRKIKCIDTQEIFDTLAQAASSTGVCADAIRNSIRQKRTCKGLTFYYLDDAPEDEFEYQQRCKDRC